MHGLGTAISFEFAARDLLLTYFFATIDLNTDVRTLASGERALLVLAVLAIGSMMLQNRAGMLMRRFRIKPSADPALDIGALHHEEPYTRLDYHGESLAVFWLRFTLLPGQSIGSLLAGIALRGAADMRQLRGNGRLWSRPGVQPGLALMSDIAFGLFLTIALMGPSSGRSSRCSSSSRR